MHLWNDRYGNMKIQIWLKNFAKKKNDECTQTVHELIRFILT